MTLKPPNSDDAAQAIRNLKADAISLSATLRLCVQAAALPNSPVLPETFDALKTLYFTVKRIAKAPNPAVAITSLTLTQEDNLIYLLNAGQLKLGEIDVAVGKSYPEKSIKLFLDNQRVAIFGLMVDATYESTRLQGITKAPLKKHKAVFKNQSPTQGSWIL